MGIAKATMVLLLGVAVGYLGFIEIERGGKIAEITEKLEAQSEIVSALEVLVQSTSSQLQAYSDLASSLNSMVETVNMLQNPLAILTHQAEVRSGLTNPSSSTFARLDVKGEWRNITDRRISSGVTYTVWLWDTATGQWNKAGRVISSDSLPPPGASGNFWIPMDLSGSLSLRVDDIVYRGTWSMENGNVIVRLSPRDPADGPVRTGTVQRYAIDIGVGQDGRVIAAIEGSWDDVVVAL